MKVSIKRMKVELGFTQYEPKFTIQLHLYESKS